MEKQNLIAEKTKELLSGHCYEGLRAAAQNWLDALGTDKESEAAESYKAMLAESISPIDDVIALFGSDVMTGKMPAEVIKHIHDHAVEVKANGGVWCDCPACSKALEIQNLLD